MYIVAQLLRVLLHELLFVQVGAQVGRLQAARSRAGPSWLPALGPFQCHDAECAVEVIHLPCSELLSKRLQEERRTLSEEGLPQSSDLRPMHEQILLDFQSRDEFCADLTERLQDGTGSVGLAASTGGPKQQYFLRDGILCVQDHRKGQEHGSRAYVPAALRAHLMYLYHRSKVFCHPGSHRMYDTMSQDYFWTGMKEDIEVYVSRCLACARAKPALNAHSGEAMAVIPETPFSVVGIDVYGPLPVTVNADSKEGSGT